MTASARTASLWWLLTCLGPIALASPARAEPASATVAEVAAPPQQRLLFVGAMGIDAGRWGLAYDRLVLGAPMDGVALRGEAGAAFTAVRHWDGMEAVDANGMAAWVGCSLAWRRARAIDGIDSAFEFLVTFAPMMTLLEQDARRLSVLGRPGVAIHYGWFAFTFGMNLEVAISQTESGPWSAADAPPTFLPGVNVGLGVAF